MITVKISILAPTSEMRHITYMHYAMEAEAGQANSDAPAIGAAGAYRRRQPYVKRFPGMMSSRFPTRSRPR